MPLWMIAGFVKSFACSDESAIKKKPAPGVARRGKEPKDFEKSVTGSRSPGSVNAISSCVVGERWTLYRIRRSRSGIPPDKLLYRSSPYCKQISSRMMSSSREASRCEGRRRAFAGDCRNRFLRKVRVVLRGSAGKKFAALFV